MQNRHINRDLYFHEQCITTAKYLIPYINNFLPASTETTVLEIGCGEGGSLKPFLDIGCSVVGIDQAKNKISNAEKFFFDHPARRNLKLIAEDIYKVNPDELLPADLIIIKDTLEHIHNQDCFLDRLKKFVKPSGKIFLAFPPWEMPFGGHQQMCENRVLSKLPYFHLLPTPLYAGMLRLFGESEIKIRGLLEIKETKITTRQFKRLLSEQNYKVDDEIFYMINPNYEIKFKIPARELPKALNIPILRDFLTTTYYCIISLNKN